MKIWASKSTKSGLVKGKEYEVGADVASALIQRGLAVDDLEKLKEEKKVVKRKTKAK